MRAWRVLPNAGLPHLADRGRFLAMIKAEILEALPKLSPEERREIRAKLNELDDEEWFDNGELSEQEKATIEARLDEYDRNAGLLGGSQSSHFGQIAWQMSYRLKIRQAAAMIGTGRTGCKPGLSVKARLTTRLTAVYFEPLHRRKSLSTRDGAGHER